MTDIPVRAKEIADQLYATQKAFLHTDMTAWEEDNKNLVAAIDMLVFCCDICVYWCSREEEHPEKKNCCVDCVKAEEEE